MRCVKYVEFCGIPLKLEALDNCKSDYGGVPHSPRLFAAATLALLGCSAGIRAPMNQFEPGLGRRAPAHIQFEESFEGGDLASP